LYANPSSIFSAIYVKGHSKNKNWQDTSANFQNIIFQDQRDRLSCFFLNRDKKNAMHP
jgi:hypothetical protein